MPTAYHMVHYRKFNGPSGSATLEALCRSALSQKDASNAQLWSRVSDRIQVLEGGGRQVVLNKVADLSSAVFGETCLVDARGLQALMQLDREKVSLSALTTAEVFNLDERRAPDGTQFLRGIVYWLAIGNHLFFVKTAGVSAELLRSYLEWLLRAGTTIPASSSLVLQAEFDRSQVHGDIGDIRSLRVKGNATPQYRVDTVEEPPAEGRVKRTTRTVADKVAEFQQALPIVQVLLGPKKAEELVNSLGPDEYLSVDAAVRVRGRRTPESKARLRQLANDLADSTDGMVQVEGKDGKLSGGDAILRTNMPFDLPYEGSSILDFNNVADQLQIVYSRFVHDHKIVV